MAVAADDDADEGMNAEENATAISVQFKRKESEALVAARLRSVNYLQKQVDAEPFVPLALFGEASEESQSILKRIEVEGSRSPISSEKCLIDPEHYISLISPTSALVDASETIP